VGHQAGFVGRLAQGALQVTNVRHIHQDERAGLQVPQGDQAAPFACSSGRREGWVVVRPARPIARSLRASQLGGSLAASRCERRAAAAAGLTWD
jgi:hypothetical protein